MRPLHLAPYKGDVSAALTLLSARLIREMGAQYQGFLWRGDGRVNINKQPGYQIVFQARVGGRTTYGKRVLLVAGPDPPPHDRARHHDALRALAGDPARRRGRRPTARSRRRFARCASAPSGRSA